MPLGDMPLFSMLRTRMKWHSERQGVLAENVANADVPNYKAKDLVEPKFEIPASLGPQRTDPHHIGLNNASQPDLFTRNSSVYEIAQQGNQVSLEDEMLKLADNQQSYQTATELYRQSINLLRTAMGRRG
jgi:flagellar basal-body rod protein FlgB